MYGDDITISLWSLDENQSSGDCKATPVTVLILKTREQ